MKHENENMQEAVLAEGEVTGHAHRLRGPRVDWDAESRRLQLDEDASLSHEEHGRQTLPRGNYTVGIVREVDHLERVVRNVAD